MAADLRGDLLAAQADVTAGDIRWLSPLPLWTGILAGPLAWGFDLTMSYALVKWSCNAHREGILRLVTIVAVAVLAVGTTTAWMAFIRTAHDAPTDGGLPRQRARFMAILGLVSSAFFALTIAATTIPQGLLDACQ